MRTTVQAFAMVAAVPAALLIATSVAAVVCGVWSQIERRRSARLRQSIVAERARSRAALRLCDGLIGAGREAVVAWGSSGSEPLSFGGGSDLLALCLSSAQGAAVSAALAGLRQDGIPFALTPDSTEGESIALRGCVIGGYAAIFLRRKAMAISVESEHRVMPHELPSSAALESRKLNHVIDPYVHALNQVGHAVAIFGRDRRLISYNPSYRRLFDLPKAWLDGHPGEGEILDRLREIRRLPEQTDFAAWKRTRLELFENSGHALEELWHVPNGSTLRVVARRRPSGGFVYLFEDVSDRLRQKSAHNALIKVQQATLDTLQEGVAVFGTDGRLRLHNTAFARQWRLHDEELCNMPHLNAIANACARRFGRDRLWETISGGVTSASPDQYGGSIVVERSDGRIISLGLTHLPDGATLVTFADLTDHVRLQAALREQPIANLLNEA